MFRINSAIALGWLAILTACSGPESGEEGGSTDDPNSHFSNQTPDAGSTGGSPSGSQVNVSFDGHSIADCRINVNGSTCTGLQYEPETTPLDIYVMFDQTGSTCSCVDPPGLSGSCPIANCKKTRLDAVREAMADFLQDSKSNGIGVGIGYFGQYPIGSADCRDQTYETPAVGIGTLPAQTGAIIDSLERVQPVGETPTGAAIRGACNYAATWKQSHFTHKVVILLVTDGLPEAPVSCPTAGCCPTLSDAVSAAQSCLTRNGGIQTYVLGVGPYLDNLQQIAAAGGTKSAYLVGDGDVAAQVLAALNAIRGSAYIPCSLGIPRPPSGDQLDYGQVNIAFADSACQGTLFTHVSAASACGAAAGWYYDDNLSPTHVELCPTSCSQVSIAGGQLMFTVGCQTVDTPVVN